MGCSHTHSATHGTSGFEVSTVGHRESKRVPESPVVPEAQEALLFQGLETTGPALTETPAPGME